MAGKLFIISAPSGAGKTSLAKAFLERFGAFYRLDRVITYTTKKARPEEVSGRDYHFISKKEFEERIDQGFFMEWSQAYDAYYGCPRYILDATGAGRSCLLIIDRVGAQQIVRQCDDAVLIWIYTRDIAELRQRLAARKEDSEAQIVRRILRAQEEIKLELQCPLYQYHLLNDEFERALCKLVTIVKRELYSGI